MSKPSRQTIEDIFLEAIELQPDERDAFIESRCRGDETLSEEVRKLVAADELAGDDQFLRSAMFTEATGALGATEATGADGAGDRGVGPADELQDPNHRFRILRAHRQGGLGEVLLAHDRELDRDVAVKQIKSSYKDNLEARQRFIQEAKVTGRLEHPGIVPVYAMGTWPDGSHYYAMRFIEGDTMKDAIASYHDGGTPSDTESDTASDRASDRAADSKRLQLRELLSRFVDVCNTIEYAHSKRVLHRDIKPSNIMVGPYGETLVVDWGLAKLLDESGRDSMTEDLVQAFNEAEKNSNVKAAGTTAGKDPGSGSTPTRVGGTVGTPHYMSPEQAAGKINEVSTPTDVYLLGATLYQILTGKPPHAADSVSKLLKQISSGVLTRPSEVNPAVDSALEAICLKAMSTSPHQRYDAAISIAEDVNRWMADQSVSVHSESLSIRVGRWMRHHRTATTSMAVAAVLLIFGGLFGSMIWNEARLQRFRADETRRTAQLESELKDRQRLAEVAANADAAEAIARSEIAQGNFASALNVSEALLSGLSDEQGMTQQIQRLREMAGRMRALVDFYRLHDEVQEQNILSRDTKALMAGTKALKTLGVWEHSDWWNAIPDQDLAPAQRDQLRWDVYQQLMLIDAMLIKTIGVRLAGDGRVGGAGGALRAAGRLLTTNAGKAEAAAALAVSDRIDRFRVSEASRFYRSIASMRLGTGARLQGKDLGLTENAADAHSLAVLSMIAAVDPSFEMIFRNYQGDDSLATARNQFSRSAALHPGHYVSHLGLGQVEYLLASRNPDATWEDFDPCVQAFGHCITLIPDRCFALNDRSSIYRFQANLIADDTRYQEDERAKRVAERLQWSLADAERAMQSYQRHPWVGWQTGFVQAEIGQLDRAMSLWNRTVIDTYPLGEIADATFLKVDDLRGRAEIADWLEERLANDAYGDRAPMLTVLSGIRLNQQRNEAALELAESALQLDPSSIQAKALRGMVLLRAGAFHSAQIDFGAVMEAQPDHPWANFGLGRCSEQSNQFQEAADYYRLASQASITVENQAAGLLGGGRAKAFAGQFDEAKKDIQRAIELEPACDLMSVVRSLAKRLQALKRSKKTSSKDSSNAVVDLTELLKSLAKLPRGTNVEVMPETDPKQTVRASVLNGGFEIGSMKYWDVTVESQPRDSSDRATKQTEQIVELDQNGHSGKYCLRLRREGQRHEGQRGSDRTESEASVCRVTQTFSVVQGTRYQLSCWIKADGLSDDSFQILSPDSAAVVQVSGGTYPWRRVTGKFVAPVSKEKTRPGRGKIVAGQLQMVASGGGTVWVDDLVVEEIR